MLNKVELIGYLGANPDIRETAEKIKIATVKLATSRRYKSAQGEVCEETEWHRLVFFGELAEFAHKYLRRGMLIRAEGRLKTRKWMREDQEHYTTEIIVRELLMLSKKDSEAKEQ